jgi:hypothetical protein
MLSFMLADIFIFLISWAKTYAAEPTRSAPAVIKIGIFS